MWPVPKRSESSDDRNDSSSGSLRSIAFRLLARREYARAELRKRLAKHAESSETLDALLDSLEAGLFLSDARYAEQRTRIRSARLGDARLEYELRTKGVDGAIIETALEGAGHEVDRARALWQRKFGVAPTTRDVWARQARFLQSRGFSSETIRTILNDRDEPDERGET